MRFQPGDRVRTTAQDPPHHTRVPRYARGAAGVVVEPQGTHALPDDRSRGVTTIQPVYTVVFEAHELFGEGDHRVTVDVWESHLEAAT